MEIQSSEEKKAIRNNDIENPTFMTVFRLIWRIVKSFFHERAGQIIGSTFLLLMVWGFHGNLDLFKYIRNDWSIPGKDTISRIPILSFIPWDREFISFFSGFCLLVIIPCIIIKFGFKQKLKDYGLGLPPKGKRALGLSVFLTLTAICIPFFYIAAQDSSMQSVYPFYKNFTNLSEFAVYELTYFPFFIAIEFIFRGYLMFGLAGVKDFEIQKAGEGVPGRLYFYRYAILIQMLSYTAWHLGKPLAELWGTPIWGLAAGVCTYSVRSIWPATFSHWILNVFLDAIILHNIGSQIF